MPEFRCLPDHLRPLADKFYRSQRSAMRTRSAHQVWVAQDPHIIAALCLQPVAGGQWLTSLLVDAEHRHRGVASALLENALEALDMPVWLFCHPNLEPVYQRQGFQACEQPPPELAERLRRYRMKKELNVMAR
ncbi:GNAT family N-acetyltransferase [Phytopseudomonas punonensis]|uniref:Acetyltransferase (GNAT) domain-containing protein n=1 Tax=Phytopseudomonas punonensis TaxID=1220495 RepID=A0A1M7D6Y2_9GAMM|nr:GNAT family N-acetyltransferase [Pseudomonas punonensis]SHL75224.1 Acetyltransferase (GNAT) domain-containing protein [Pseudomonas punonensis]